MGCLQGVAGMSWIKDYRLVADLDEAVELLARPGEGWAVLGGGSRLVAQRPPTVERLLDLLPLGLDRIESRGDGALRFGARVRVQGLADRADREGVLRDAALSLGHSLNLRNQMTLAGETAWPLAFSELQTAWVALDARILRHGRGATPAAEYLAAPERSGVITGIEIPPAPGWRFGFHAVRAAESARPQLLLVAGARVVGGSIAESRLVVGRLGDRPQRARGLEARLVGAPALPLGLGSLAGLDREGLVLLSEPAIADEAKWSWAAALLDEFLTRLGAPQ